MTQADGVLSTPPTNTSQSFAALAAAVHPAWHHAILGLSYELEGISDRLDKIRECKERRDFVSRCRVLVDTLIEVLDEIDGDPDLEEDDREDIGDDEPSLDSFDRMINQNKAWRTQSLWAFPAVDAEQDDCDREDDDPNEERDQPPEMGGAA